MIPNGKDLCPKCRNWKKTEYPTCWYCHQIASGERTDPPPPAWEREYTKYADARSERYLLDTYNMTAQEYNIMLDNQQGMCFSCGFPATAETRLVVDHDHADGYVRALLCDRCNHILGLAQDNAAILAGLVRLLYREVKGAELAKPLQRSKPEGDRLRGAIIAAGPAKKTKEKSPAKGRLLV